MKACEYQDLTTLSVRRNRSTQSGSNACQSSVDRWTLAKLNHIVNTLLYSISCLPGSWTLIWGDTSSPRTETQMGVVGISMASPSLWHFLLAQSLACVTRAPMWANLNINTGRGWVILILIMPQVHILPRPYGFDGSDWSPFQASD